MKVLIYGAGSVGLGLASFLLKSGAELDILAREQTVSALKEHGLERSGIFGDFHAAPSQFGCFSSLREIPKQVFDYIFVCTKSPDSHQAAEDISRHSFLTDEGTGIILSQNGWGNAEIFSSFFPKEQIFSARVITGFTRPRPNEVLITVHADAIHIGSLFGADPSRLEDICGSIRDGGMSCETTEHIERDLWAKMLYNCALNPLGAVLDVPYGKLAESDFTRQIMNSIVDEVFKVLAATGYTTHWSKPADFLEVFYDKLVPDTAQHKSSTLQDILAKKKTEIDAMNGAVIKLAEEHGIDVPFNRAVYNAIKFIESN